uniref:Uncharacterized protein n=1 Tax=uncultured Desulfobacterium sp. TaxID=201089 RepID=E1YMA7_9BACT|nr:unknown protein [uncultured Desulfobacterium sp.]
MFLVFVVCQKNRNFEMKNILLSVVGLSPQVITETLYALLEAEIMDFEII